MPNQELTYTGYNPTTRSWSKTTISKTVEEVESPPLDILNSSLQRTLLRFAGLIPAQMRVLGNHVAVIQNLTRISFNSWWALSAEATSGESPYFTLTGAPGIGRPQYHFVWTPPTDMMLKFCTVLSAAREEAPQVDTNHIAFEFNNALRFSRTLSRHEPGWRCYLLAEDRYTKIHYALPVPNQYPASNAFVLCPGQDTLVGNSVLEATQRLLEQWASNTWNTDLYSSEKQIALQSLIRFDGQGRQMKPKKPWQELCTPVYPTADAGSKDLERLLT